MKKTSIAVLAGALTLATAGVATAKPMMNADASQKMKKAAVTKMKEGSCGAAMQKKAGEGKCGAKSASAPAKAAEGKCGEGSCGSH